MCNVFLFKKPFFAKNGLKVKLLAKKTTDLSTFLDTLSFIVEMGFHQSLNIKLAILWCTTELNPPEMLQFEVHYRINLRAKKKIFRTNLILFYQKFNWIFLLFQNSLKQKHTVNIPFLSEYPISTMGNQMN